MTDRYMAELTDTFLQLLTVNTAKLYANIDRTRVGTMLSCGYKWSFGHFTTERAG
jgi:hypothetical protein